jgi:hypothetical protein
MVATVFTAESVTRALDAHKKAGLIKNWRRVVDPRFQVAVDLVDGQAGFRLGSLREAYVFVAGLASAHHAYLRHDLGVVLGAAVIRQHIYPVRLQDGSVSNRVMDMEPGDCQRALRDLCQDLRMEEGRD